jgi:hypothetical protein
VKLEQYEKSNQTIHEKTHISKHKISKQGRPNCENRASPKYKFMYYLYRKTHRSKWKTSKEDEREGCERIER